jgi:hypothetical protein
MSIEAAIGFWKRVAEDPALQEKVNPRGGAVPAVDAEVSGHQLQQLSTIAGECGFEADGDEFATVEAVLRFWEAVAVDPRLQDRIRPSETLSSVDDAAGLVASVANDAGFRFSPQELIAATESLAGTGWMTSVERDDEVEPFSLAGTTGTTYLQPTSSTLQTSPFVSSFNLATSGQLSTSFRRVGPGLAAEYM